MAIIPAVRDLTVYQGDTYDLPIRIRGRTINGGFGDYLDLTGYTAKAQIRATEASTTVLAEFATSVPTQTGDNLGRINMLLTHTQTAALTQNTMVWDVQVESPAGEVRTLLRGQVNLIKEVTR